MKAIIEKNETYKITGEKGAFFISESNKGKVKMFLKSDVTVIDIDALPQAKTYKQAVLKKDKNYSNDFRNRLQTALENETGRTGSIEFLQSI